MFSVISDNLIKRYGKKEVFRDINFSYNGAYCIGIQGPNGSGKSTLLKCLSGLIRPSHGNLLWSFNEHNIDLSMIRYYIGFSGPYIHLYQELSVYENLAFIKSLRSDIAPDKQNITRKEKEQHNLTNKSKELNYSEPSESRFSPLFRSLDTLTSFMEINHLLESPYGVLSSGQQQRVKLAVALAASPPILMLDEPGTNLDTDGQECISKLIEFQKNAGGMIFLASNREEELALCDFRIKLSIN
ncbi:ATP-binding cassette domain-containing protein [Balneolaceae bacterium ANBcel3]|nr:ATP-binding cassette domain-containing protein [Balneolaceae bacterium ANBcel3]